MRGARRPHEAAGRAHPATPARKTLRLAVRSPSARCSFGYRCMMLVLPKMNCKRLVVGVSGYGKTLTSYRADMALEELSVLSTQNGRREAHGADIGVACDHFARAPLSLGRHINETLTRLFSESRVLR